jgi:hypothetical protein
MSWVTIAVTVGTAIVGAYEQHQVAKKQDNQIASQLRQQAASEEKVNQRTKRFALEQQQQTDQPQKTAAAKGYQDALTANKAMANQPLANVGNVSEAYKKAGSDAALGITSYGKNLGDLTASIDAPGQQRQQNQRNINDFGIDVNQINRGQKGQDFLDSMKLNSIHANPYVSLLMNAAKSYASAKAGAGSGGGTASTWGVDSGGDYSGYA